jgi:hypothetical protein
LASAISFCTALIFAARSAWDVSAMKKCYGLDVYINTYITLLLCWHINHMYICMYVYIYTYYIYISITWLMMYFGSYMLQDKKLRLGSAAQRIQMALVIFSLSSSTFRSSRGHGHHMAHVVSCVLQTCQLSMCPLVCRHPDRMMMVMMMFWSPLSPRYLKQGPWIPSCMRVEGPTSSRPVETDEWRTYQP